MNSQRLNFPLRTFRPKKGDTLIWSADLAHGGTRSRTAPVHAEARSATIAPKASRPTTFDTGLQAPQGASGRRMDLLGVYDLSDYGSEPAKS